MSTIATAEQLILRESVSPYIVCYALPIVSDCRLVRLNMHSLAAEGGKAVVYPVRCYCVIHARASKAQEVVQRHRDLNHRCAFSSWFVFP